MTDASIIKLFFDRDEKAVEESRNKYGKLCFTVARNILYQLEDVEECVNDTYMTLWNTIPPEKPKYLSSYVCKITKNNAINKLKHNTAKKRNSEYLISLNELTDYISGNGEIDDTLCTKLLSEAISKFLWKQDEKARKIFVRRYWFGDSISTISKLYDIKEKTVSVILFRTRNNLKKYLIEEGVIDE